MVPPLGLGRSNIEGEKNITKEMLKRILNPKPHIYQMLYE